MPAMRYAPAKDTRDAASPRYGEPQYYEHVDEGGVGFTILRATAGALMSAGL